MNVENIRKDFPILSKKIHGKPIVYFDNACMTLRPMQVINAITEYYTEYSACAGRSYHYLSKQVTERYEEARESIRRFIGAKRADEIVFTRNTTEGLNLVANSLDLNKGNIVLTTDREHNSNLMPWQILAKKKGIVHNVVLSNEDNTFNLETFKKMMSKNVKLVSMVHTSNLDGYTIPAKEIIKIAHEHGALVMLDGAQSSPHIELDVNSLDVDFLAFSGHKLCGPTGTGALYGKTHLLEKLSPFIVGGDTAEDTTYKSHKLMAPPEKFEAGLQNYAGALGFAAATEYISKIGKKDIEEYDHKLNKKMTEGVNGLNEFKIIGPSDPKMRGGIVNLAHKSIDPHDIAMILNESSNIMVRSGAHCVHSWFNAHKMNGSVRASLYFYNTEKEVEFFIEKLREVLKFFK